MIQWRAGQGMEPQSIMEVQKQGSNTQWGRVRESFMEDAVFEMGLY